MLDLVRGLRGGRREVGMGNKRERRDKRSEVGGPTSEISKSMVMNGVNDEITISRFDQSTI